MNISSKGRYGLRAMLDLAMHSSTGHVPLRSIAQRQGISENYLLQVFASLRKAGLVNSVKGAQGGYVLADRAENISVGMILRVLEGDLSVNQTQAGEESDALSYEQCLETAVWGKINAAINNVVDSINLADLSQDFQKNHTPEALMFFI